MAQTWSHNLQTSLSPQELTVQLRMNWWFLLWLHLPLVLVDSDPCSTRNDDFPKNCRSDFKNQKTTYSDASDCMKTVSMILTHGHQNPIKAILEIENEFENMDMKDTTSMSSGSMVAVLHKPNSKFSGLVIYANSSEAKIEAVPNTKVIAKMPRELDVGPNNTIVFCMITLPEMNQTTWKAPGLMYEGRLVGLSVSGKNISGLQEPVSIIFKLTTPINETQQPRCVFLNFSTENYSSDGCLTLWQHGQSNITCSCDHLTYFGVLLVDSVLSPEDQKVLSYITLAGCSISLLSLVITVLLFIIYRKFRADVSMKVHISLVVALILLNGHFLLSHLATQLSLTGLCIYMALALHYSLLATFSWMALEGFHLYLLLVRVFNIYIRRYLLKLSVVGWGVPAVVVSLVVAIDRNAYGAAPLDSSNPNSTSMCYITNVTVKMVSTMGVIGLVFIFNVIVLGVTIRRVIILQQNQQFAPSHRDRGKRVILTLLGITTLLGIPWGVVFFSVITPGQYIFCILISLQGFCIFLWFVMSLRQAGKSTANATHSTSQPRDTQ